jgi:Icc-related predicted phosphoesterase
VIVVGDFGEPVHQLRYLNAAKRGGTEVCRLVFDVACVDGLPDDLDAIIACSDLQGIVPEPHTREARLLGIAVAEELDELAFDGKLPPAARTGIVLAGDLYSVPDANKRGGHGDVAPVWQAFAERFAWVVGVGGNHDDMTAVERTERAIALDTEVVVLDGLRIGGVDLICGNPAKPGRRDAEDQLARIDLVASEGVDLLVLHEGPHGDDEQSGNPAIRTAIERHRVPLTICGHCHWDAALATHPHGQILNVDARVVVLRR